MCQGEQLSGACRSGDISDMQKTCNCGSLSLLRVAQT